MAACLFPANTRVAFRSNTKIRGAVSTWFDGDRDIPPSKSMYCIHWDGVSGDYWYYSEELILEKDAPKEEPPKDTPKKSGIQNDFVYIGYDVLAKGG
jgi:hypothetical protein